MSKVLILVEGFTEEKFVKEILKPYFELRGIFVIPRNLKGVGNYKLIHSEIKILLKDSSVLAVTTMLDFYRIPSDFPGFKDLDKTLHSTKKVQNLENLFAQSVEDERFLPYLQLHEFEALLFSDVSHFKRIPNIGNKISEFERIVSLKEPEEINDLPNTSPANRIKNILNHYTKDVHGIIVAKSIGLDKMREKCPHFHSWIKSIESLTSQKL